MTSPLAVTGYNSVTQLRSDAWSALHDAAKRMAERPSAALEQDVAEYLDFLRPLENYWGFPGRRVFAGLRTLARRGEHERLARLLGRISRALYDNSYRTSAALVGLEVEEASDLDITAGLPAKAMHQQRPYFEVLVVDDLSEDEEAVLRDRLRQLRRPEDAFVYELVVVPSYEDAVVAAMVNTHLLAAVIQYGFPLRSRLDLAQFRRFVPGQRLDEDLERLPASAQAIRLGAVLGGLRPELNLFFRTPMSVESIAGRLTPHFNRVFHSAEDLVELDLSIQRGVEAKFRTPFFTALKRYSQQPTGVFHALPISRGRSVVGSPWIHDMADFYGLNVFLAETSATSGGLDSLLEPIGPLKDAQVRAAKAFGATRTWFVTNGTSTANKIVVQSLVKPHDVVLVDRNCHKSHHYGLVLAGAQVCYLDAYPLHRYSMYGAVPLSEIKRTLLAYRRAGRLDRVKLLMLTNCTFDGIVYDVQRVMEECLAIKPDLVFLWDEAWFAFAAFHPTYRRRTAMSCASRLRDKLRDPVFRQEARAFDRSVLDDDEAALATRLLPDPERAKVRVYATQSSHKTLTALRQGSMIHIFDTEFSKMNEEAFHEAFMTHTSTSPNYQILASLDIGRRQVELEGYDLVSNQIELAMVLRHQVNEHPLLSRHFQFLGTDDLIPAEYRPAGVDRPLFQGLATMDAVWRSDEFVLDPSRLTMAIGSTGIDGETFKVEYLMGRYGIQINKTSRNTVLFMTNIGTSRSAIAFLIECLVKIATEIDEQTEGLSRPERRLHDRRVRGLTVDLPPLPDFSAFHDAFRPFPDAEVQTPEGDLRQAYFLSYSQDRIEYLTMRQARRAMADGRRLVSALFVTPYPPGFPVLVPGQVISAEILDYVTALDVKEIHGYRPAIGFCVFSEAALELAAASRRPPDGGLGARR